MSQPRATLWRGKVWRKSLLPGCVWNSHSGCSQLPGSGHQGYTLSGASLALWMWGIKEPQVPKLLSSCGLKHTSDLTLSATHTTGLYILTGAASCSLHTGTEEGQVPGSPQTHTCCVLHHVLIHIRPFLHTLCSIGGPTPALCGLAAPSYSSRVHSWRHSPGLCLPRAQFRGIRATELLVFLEPDSKEPCCPCLSPRGLKLPRCPCPT